MVRWLHWCSWSTFRAVTTSKGDAVRTVIARHFHTVLHHAVHVTMHAAIALVEFHTTEYVFRVATGHDSQHFVQTLLGF